MALVLRMEIELGEAVPAAVFPAGMRVRTADVDADAPSVHALLVRAFAASAEEVPPYVEWLAWWTGDAEFDPELWFLAEDGGELAGVVLCWSSAFVKDLAVDPARRRVGLGRALLLHALRALRARGATTAALKVDADNPTGAVRLYESVGMRIAERLEAGP